MTAKTFSTLAVALASSFTVSLHAQAVVTVPPPQPTGLTLPVAGQTTLTLDVVASPRGKDTAPVLSQADFQVLDNGRPVAIKSFRPPADNARFALILVLDTVNANYSSVAYQRGELDKFFTANGGRLAHPTTLAIMTDKGVQMQDGFATNGAELKKELDDYTVALRFIRRDEGIYGAEDRQQLGISALQVIAQKEQSVPARKVVVFISPGWPLISGPEIQLNDKQRSAVLQTIVSVNNLLQQARITVYDVNPFGAQESVLNSNYYRSFTKPIANAGKVDLGDLALQVEAEQSGGLVRLGTTDLAKQITVCEEDAASAYQLTFVPNPEEGAAHDKNSPYQLHTLQVKAGTDDIKTRTRAQYYTQPQQ